MSKPAAIPLFGDAYLADTTHLTTEEHGAYLLLMIAAWRQPDCGLPLDDKKLARIVGMSTKKWTAVKDTILDFWKVVDGRIFQPRLLKEHDYACRKSEANRKSAEARWNKQPIENKEDGVCERISEGNAPPPPPPRDIEPNGPISQREDAHTLIPAKPKKRTSTWVTIERPQSVSVEAWARFEDHRKRKRAAITDTVIEAFEREAGKLGWPLEAAIIKSIERNWQGFEADWIGNGTGNSNNGSGTNQPHGLAEAIVARRARRDGEQQGFL
jgi:uncharacterized protein YdaU (DUF1376 family)